MWKTFTILQIIQSDSILTNHAYMSGVMIVWKNFPYCQTCTVTSSQPHVKWLMKEYDIQCTGSFVTVCCVSKAFGGFFPLVFDISTVFFCFKVCTLFVLLKRIITIACLEVPDQFVLRRHTTFIFSCWTLCTTGTQCHHRWPGIGNCCVSLVSFHCSGDNYLQRGLVLGDRFDRRSGHGWLGVSHPWYCPLMVRLLSPLSKKNNEYFTVTRRNTREELYENNHVLS